MKTLANLRSLVVVGALTAAVVAGSATESAATHFRYGTMTWQPDAVNPNLISVHFESAWRWSYPYSAAEPNHCPPGYIPTGAAGNGSCPAVNSVLASLGSIVIRNAANTTVATLNLTPRVVSINSTEDWFGSVFDATATLAAGNYTAQFSSSARISTLQGGNNDQPFIVNSGITVRVPPTPSNRPPITGMLPIVVLARNQAASIQIPAFDPNGDAVTFRLSTTAESGLVQTAPAGLTLSPGGLVQWTPTVNGLYALQARITDAPGAFTVVDFIFQVKDAVGQPPVVRIDGSTSPQTLSTVRGVPVTFTVSATDPENTPVMLSSNTMPIGASMVPGLPFTTVNPSSTFSWTPAALGTFVVNFAGLDGDGRQATNSMTLNVTNTPPTITCTPSASPIEALSPMGGPFSVSAAVDDMDHDSVTVRFFVDGVQKQASALLVPPALESYSNTFALGHHTYEARVSDGFSTIPCTGTFDVVDTTPPTLTVVPGDQTVPATSPAGALVSFAATAHDLVDPAPAVHCTPLSGSTFPVGTTTVTCTATDASGNPASTSFTIHVTDPTPPLVAAQVTGTLGTNGWYVGDVSVVWTVVDAESGVATTSGCDPDVVNTDTAGVTFTCSATNNDGVASDPVSVTVKRDATAPAVTFSPTSLLAEATSAAGAAVTFDTPSATDGLSGLAGAVSCSHASGATFPLGATTVHCTATDKAGNTGAADLVVTVVDTTEPTIDPHGNLTVDATGSAGAVVGFVSPATHDAVDGDGTAHCTPAAGTFAIGTTTVTCSAVDAHGNHAAGTTFTVTVVDTPPVIEPHGNESAEATSAGGAAVTFAAPATHDAVDGDGTAVCAPASGQTFPLGTTTVTCETTDTAGHHVVSTFTVTVVDTTKPTIDAHADVSVPATSAAGAAVGYAPPATHDAVDGTGFATCAPAPGSTFALGTTSVTCAATDAHGNHADGTTFTVTVTNNPPTFTPPADITTPATSAAGAVVSFTAVGHDVESGTLPAVCGPESGTTFPIGATVVGCTVTDVAGATATGSFTVTVTNNPPTFTPPADITTPATSAAGAVVSFTAVGHDLESGTLPAVCVPATGTTFPIGTTIVSCTVTDVAGATATGSFKVTVTNNPPTFTPPADITVEATSPAGATVSYVAVGHDLESGTLPAVCAPASGATFAVGTTGVGCTVTDVAGATASGTFSVTVTDHTAPVLHLPADIVVHASGPSGSVVAFTATATDIVDVTDPVTCVPGSGSTFAIGTATVACSATDAHANGAAGSFHVTVTNTAPVAKADAYTGQWNTPITVPAKGVLANDTDADGDALSAAPVAGPAHGTLTLNADGGFTYMPAPNYFGTDSFTYRASDGLGGSSVATVTLTVTTSCPGIVDRDRDHDRDHYFGRDENHDYGSHDYSDGDCDDRGCTRGTPIAANDSFSTKQATTLTVPARGVLANDGRYAATVNLITPPANGTVTLNANGGFVYVPAPTFYGVDTFVYVARTASGLAGPVATVRIAVKKNLAPDADNDFYAVGRNSTLTVSASDGVLDDDSDPNGDPLTAVLVSGPAHGTLTLGTNGSFVYKPATNYTGVDTFVYKARDPLGLEDTATVTVRVGVYGSGTDQGGQHHDHDGCDHEQHRNGHFDGDGCRHDRLHD